jgi:hypothetical protein
MYLIKRRRRRRRRARRRRRDQSSYIDGKSDSRSQICTV